MLKKATHSAKHPAKNKKHRATGSRFVGAISALIFFGLALTPSLLPRPAFFTGMVAGISAAIGYGFGVLIAYILRKVRLTFRWPTYSQLAWRILGVVGLVYVLAMIGLARHWQNNIRHLVHEEPLQSYHFITILLVSALFATLLYWLAVFVRWVFRKFNQFVGAYLPRAVSILLSLGLTVLVFWALFSGVIFQGFVALANRSYSGRNNSTPPGINQPTDPNRSGSPDSLASWDSLGYTGKEFVGRGPSAEDISRWSSQPAMDQIRVYIGVNTKPTTDERAKLALDELKRTKAFDRKYLIVTTPTGTGWIEPQTADTIGYLTNGNSAMVAVQYSYLPSWISFLTDKDKATQTGTALYRTVYDYWKTLPSDHRPQLIAYGLSLGSFGAQAAFTDSADLQQTSEGAVFVGSPSDSEPWGLFTRHRDLGSHEVLPVYQNGQHIRFAASKDQVLSNSAAWQTQRVLYLQHGSDPVVWFSFDLINHEPDWLKEPKAPDVTKDMHWMPIVTFLQVTVDQFFGTTVPNGFGHNYNDIAVYAWNSVLANQAWTPQQIESLQETINNYAIE